MNAMYQSERRGMNPHPVRPEEVLVFRTSVNSHDQVDALRPLLELTVAGGEWNFDLEDCDHVLRVDAEGMLRERIMALLTGLGFSCEELD
jgi:hypothetical protein